jgi:DNA helicase IV
MLYGRLDSLRDRASGRLSKVLLETGGTPAARSERDAFVEMYSQRITQLDAAENGLCFGRLDLAEGDRRYIGRIGILDDASDYEALLVDWRAPAARPFYIATAFSPEGVLRRRHIRTRQRKVTGVDDEVLDVGTDGQASPDQAAGRAGLTGEAALIAALSATRTGRMADIVETIQAEQDLIIRSPHNGVTVVQGAPGTGKTAVALHRAAYLLYTYREQLSRRGVLIVGPNPTFLRYSGHVLPSLGETGVLMSTIADLYPGISARRDEAPETAEIKGRPAMAGLLAAAVRNRQQLPAEPLEITFEREVLKLDRKTVQQARERARRSRRPHNQARPIFVREIINALVQQVTSKFTAGLRETDKMVAEILGEEIPAADSTVLGSADTEDIRAQLRQDPKVRAAITQLWPVLTPQRLLDDLFASPRRLAAAAPRLAAAERDLLRREPRSGWTPADVPLLDEAAELLGDDDRVARQRARRERQQEVAYAQGVLDIVSRDLEDDPEILMAYDLLNADRLAGRHEELSYLTTAERAALDRTWAFGHIVVDEAQELSEMAWRMLMRRCPSRSMTIAGDIAQSSNPASAVSWEQVLTPHLGNRWRLDRLTINYRTPAEIMAVAADVLAKINPDFDVPMSVRETGTTPWRQEVKEDELAGQVALAAASEAAQAGGGNVAVLVPPALVAEVSEAVAAALRAGANGHAGHGGPDLDGADLDGVAPDGAGPDGAGPGGAGPDRAGPGRAPELDGPDLDEQVVVLTVSQAKGLEFDSVLIADPAQILGESPRGLSDLYVAMTRATQRLGVVHPGPVPEVLHRLTPRP